MQPFSFDRSTAERSLADPDGALWPVNAYSDADELDSLVQAALDSGAIAATERRARLYIYPLSLSEPDPVLVYDPGFGRAFLGHALKLREREGESPVGFTLRLLEDVTAEADALARGVARGYAGLCRPTFDDDGDRPQTIRDAPSGAADPEEQTIERLRRACGYDPEREGPVDDLIAYKDALEDRLRERTIPPLSPEARGVIAALVADEDDLPDGVAPEAIVARRQIWEEIREAFPLLAGPGPIGRDPHCPGAATEEKRS